VVIDIVLPAMLSLILVREAGIESCMYSSISEARGSVRESNYQLGKS
jgi:hypothetical protein